MLLSGPLNNPQRSVRIWQFGHTAETCWLATRAQALPGGARPLCPDYWSARTVMLFGVRFSYKMVSPDTGGTLAVMEVEIPSGTLVKPHNHSREDEFSLVLSGTVGVRIGDQVLEAGPGAYLAKPRGIPRMPCGTRPAPPPRWSRSSPLEG